ncbi:MAG: cytochrome c [Caldilineaceae bacterium]|nr:cytochrome c [Caldilineaceae bacterium]
MRGLLWTAEGKPDVVPPLPGGEAEAGAELDGATLYNQFECSRCHGIVGEGGVAAALNQTEWPEDELIDIIRNGRDAMNGYPPETLLDEELQALIPYVQAIGRGEVESTIVLYKRQLPPPRLSCSDAAQPATRTDCGGN